MDSRYKRESLKKGDVIIIPDFLAALSTTEILELVEIFLADINFRESILTNGGHVPEHSQIFLTFDQHTSLWLNEKLQRQLKKLQSLAEEMRQATTYEQKLRQSLAEEIGGAPTNKRRFTQLRSEHVESARKMVADRKTDMMEHLLRLHKRWRRMLKRSLTSRQKLIKSLQQNENQISVLTKFFSTETTERRELGQKDELNYRDQQKNQERKPRAENDDLIAVHKAELVSLSIKVASLSATVTELKKTQASKKCCICMGELEGSASPSSRVQSSPSKQLLKRACFLPCMHAGVCTSCSLKRWKEGPQVCPVCQQILTVKPKAIHL